MKSHTCSWEDALNFIKNNSVIYPTKSTNSKPLVSVCVTTYNHRLFLPEALDGILAQKTTFPFEIIVGDDCSDDGTFDLARDYQNDNPSSIRVVRSTERLGKHTGNGRLNFIRNIFEARGEFCAILEGDDYWIDDTKLQEQLNMLYASGAASCVSHHCERIGSKVTEPITIYQNADAVCKYLLTHSNQIATASTLFKTEFLRSNLKKIFANSYGDWSLHFLSALYHPIPVLKKATCIYRRHSRGINSQKRPSEQARPYGEIYDFMSENWKGDPAIVRVMKSEAIERLGRDISPLALAHRKVKSFPWPIRKLLKKIVMRNTT